MPKPKKPQAFEEIMESLEETVERLESGDLPLEESLEIFKHGVEMVKEGTKRLNDMERKVELLMGDMDSDETQAFDIDDDDE